MRSFLSALLDRSLPTIPPYEDYFSAGPAPTQSRTKALPKPPARRLRRQAVPAARFRHASTPLR